jgi:hypothetical protein
VVSFRLPAALIRRSCTSNTESRGIPGLTFSGLYVIVQIADFVRIRTTIAICTDSHKNSRIDPDDLMADGIYAVLIADIVASTARRDVRALLRKNLAAASEKHLRRKLIRLPYTVTAGDEFQTMTGELPALPALILDLRSALRPLSLRVGVGIGSVSGRIQPPVNQLTGEAFQLARRAIEGIKERRLFKFAVLTAFASGNEDFNDTINLIYGLHDTLVLQITSKQWEAIGAFLSRETLAPTARRLRVDISTVSRNLKRGYYWQLAETVNRAGSFIERTFG